MKNFFKNTGPGPLVAAAFIGPGTVTICTMAGVNFGFTLLWAMTLSILATLVLQEMAARLGIISQKGLSEIIRTEINNPVLKSFTVILILSAIVIGNAAYEAGNISGGVLGLETFTGTTKIELLGFSINFLSVLIGLIAFILLYFGNYKVIESALITLVILMSLAFLTTAILTKPNISNIFKGMFIPTFPENGLLVVIGLIGTTVVPYNLFLHASLVKEKWKRKSDLSFARKDTYIAVVLGGLVSVCIIISAASIQNMDVLNASDLAKGLEPLFGNFAKYFLAIGLFAAGITSAITAPLAAAYVACGCLGFKSDLKSKKFRGIWMFILLLGVLLSSLNIKPIDIIKFAQVANGILLPVIVIVLIWIMNKSSVLGVYRNNIKQNILGIFILCITILLSISALNKVFGLNIF
ncbi:Nramp family divalent metal transporter [Seonamhaeicola aphaedonensis]|uniref:NRAMP (Natural resistance-associated macrophage protein)-like metal ion transporter n=1 Tax=Seonamhaeicola aphaedonensis TaxID=1461338 RepID=A0A3D9HJZ7_9FLAO|nr:Nramp family divalent metal transporter [Seonamhaeicola aphaedonensis]RED49246.1 NRAMP (natural resistance-associated macrophage protein)-like metal ion transporter [Seonamhaeicola aphaedonensis]